MRCLAIFVVVVAVAADKEEEKPLVLKDLIVRTAAQQKESDEAVKSGNVNIAEKKRKEIAAERAMWTGKQVVGEGMVNQVAGTNVFITIGRRQALTTDAARKEDPI